MKKLAFSFLFSMACCMAMAQSLLPSEKTLANKEKKLILLNFSGSDWCIPCIKMQKEYFENADFKSMADSQLVIVRADFPRKKKNMPSPEMVKRNEQLAERFNQNGSFPLTLLLDEELNILKKWDGLPEITAAEFSKDISTIVKQHTR